MYSHHLFKSHTVATEAVLQALTQAERDAYLERHQHGDWGVNPVLAEMSDEMLSRTQGNLFSAFESRAGRLFVKTNLTHRVSEARYVTQFYFENENVGSFQLDARARDLADRLRQLELSRARHHERGLSL